MIRNAMFGLSLLAFSAGSAFAGASKHQAKPVVVAEAPAADTAAPTDKPADEKKTKKSKKEKSTKTDGKTETKPEGAKEMAPTPPVTK
jgi:outer membrane biosynthesis protein TonB